MDEKQMGSGVVSAIRLWAVQTLCVLGALVVGVFVWVNFFEGQLHVELPQYGKLIAVTYEYETDKGGTMVETVKGKR